MNQVFLERPGITTTSIQQPLHVAKSEDLVAQESIEDWACLWGDHVPEDAVLGSQSTGLRHVVAR
jgi:hypothetical protein